MYTVVPSMQCYRLHLLQVSTQGMSRAKMRLISLQPYQALHDHLVQCVIILPQTSIEVADLSAAISASISVIISACIIHLSSILLSQVRSKKRWGFHYHIRTGAGIIWRQVHSECVLFVVGASNSDLNFCVASWIDPRHSTAEVLLQQFLLKCEPLLLGCWPRHDWDRQLMKTARVSGEVFSCNRTVVNEEYLIAAFPPRCFPQSTLTSWKIAHAWMLE